MPTTTEALAQYRADLASQGDYAFPGLMGMTLRDYFAAAVAGHIWDGLPDDMDTGTCAMNAAQKAYIIADAMLRERNR